MAIPIDISQLIDGNVVEGARIEYKSGWNPEDIIHSICAFANDIDNLGGGYIVVGIEEQDGMPVKPVRGLTQASLDAAQKELLRLCNRLTPSYMPLCDPVSYDGRQLLLIWAPGGYDRPYTAPESLSAKRSARAAHFQGPYRPSDHGCACLPPGKRLRRADVQVGRPRRGATPAFPQCSERSRRMGLVRPFLKPMMTEASSA